MEEQNLMTLSKSELINMIEKLRSKPNEVEGTWKFLPETDPSIKDYWWQCSICGKTIGQGLDILVPTSYCPRCGSKMSEDY